jgi:hypothetical protein
MFEGVEGAGHHPVKTAPGSRGGSGGGGSGSPGQASPGPDKQRQNGGAAAAGGVENESPDGEQQQQGGSGDQKQQQGGSGGGASKQQQQDDPDDFDEAVTVGDAVTVGYRAASPAAGYESHAVVKWRGGAVGDMMADAVVAVILQAAGEPPAAAAAEAARAAALAAGDAEAAVGAEMELAASLLRAQFGVEGVVMDAGALEMRMAVDGVDLKVDYKGVKVECGDEGLRGRVERALGRVMQAMRPCVLDGEA